MRRYLFRRIKWLTIRNGRKVQSAWRLLKSKDFTFAQMKCFKKSGSSTCNII